MSAPFFVGPSACAGTAGEIAQTRSTRSEADFAAGAGREDYRRRVARAFPGPVAQDYLAAGATGSLTVDFRFLIFDFRSGNILADSGSEPSHQIENRKSKIENRSRSAARL